jgi:hypothetical protein
LLSPHSGGQAGLPAHGSYFPELFLSSWFRGRGEEVPVYSFELCGAKPLAEGYRALVDRLDIDAVVLVDGGSDSLMRGDEEGLGTPSEDIASLVALSMVEVPVKILACIGFGVDWHHGVCHSRFLEATSELAASGGYLGLFSLLKEMPEAALFREACEYVVASSVLSALDGRFGNYHAYDRTRKGELWISPLMSAYWCYRLSAVADRVRRGPGVALAAISRREGGKDRAASQEPREAKRTASDLVVDHAPLGHRSPHEGQDDLVLGVGLVRVERGARGELRVEREVAAALGPRGVDAHLYPEEPRDTAPQGLELLLDQQGVRGPVVPVRALLELPHHDVLEHSPTSCPSALAGNKKPRPEGTGRFSLSAGWLPPAMRGSLALAQTLR